MKYNDEFLDKEFPGRKRNATDTAESLATEKQSLTREAVKSAGTIRALEDRLNRIESLARHALAANPRDLEGTWMRIEQIAGSEG